MPAGTNVPSGVLVSPGGQQGIPGPNAVSTDAGNQAAFGSDARIYVPDPTPVITSVRLRAFSSIGNPNFEVDQINVGNTVTGFSGKPIDRWTAFNQGSTWSFTTGQTAGAVGDVVVPGTNFRISRTFYRFTLTAQQATLAAGDGLSLYQYLEGPQFRELAYDVHSSQVLVRSSVAGLKFGVALRDTPVTKSLTKLCTIPSANTWTLIQMPNLPVWATGGNWNSLPGNVGAFLWLSLAAGSTYTSPANDSWQNGNFFGAVGQSNFAASPVNSTFDIAFVQHEPGPQCTTLIDKPFNQNYDEVLRYYQKSFSYPVKPGTADPNGVLSAIHRDTTYVSGFRYIKPMGKVPTLSIYNPNNGAVNSFTLAPAGGNYSTASYAGLGDSGLQAIGGSSLPAPVAGSTAYYHYTADTGW